MAGVSYGVGEAHGKVILAGEHIVVYDKPAIAIPFPLRIRAIVTGNGGGISLTSGIYTGGLEGMPAKLRGLAQAIQRALELCGKPEEGIHIEIKSEVPVGRGLGSSAAAAAAIVRGIYHFFQKPLPEEELFSLVETAERYAHGKPSGIDMRAVASDEPIFYRRSQGVIAIPVPRPINLVVADTGISADTKTAVSHVTTLMQQKPGVIARVIDEIEDIVLQAREAMLKGDSVLLGSLMLRNHEALLKLEVSHLMLDRLVETAMIAGALGAKLTGGGMGGCMVALARDMNDAVKVGEMLIKEGARAAWCFSTDSREPVRMLK